MPVRMEEMETYRAGARRRGANEKKQLLRRYQHAWEIAGKGAQLLKKEFHAKEVVVFGSLVHKELFHMKSDVDVAVLGLDEKLYYRAVSRLLDLDADIQTDLVMTENASESLRTRIEKEGIAI
ncbi:MAG: nucleotidyltransferase domain-containing protein [Desulfobacterales bacterium]